MGLDGEQHARPGRHDGLGRSQLVADAAGGARVEHLVAQRVHEALGAHGAGRAAHGQQGEQRPGRARERGPGRARPRCGPGPTRRRPRPSPATVRRAAAGSRGGGRLGRRARRARGSARARARRRAGARARGRCGPWPRGGARRCRRRTVTASIDGRRHRVEVADQLVDAAGRARARGRPPSRRPRPARRPAPAARSRGSIGSPPATTTTVVGRSEDVGTAHRFPPLALPRSGSRVGDAPCGVVTLSARLPRAPLAVRDATLPPRARFCVRLSPEWETNARRNRICWGRSGRRWPIASGGSWPAAASPPSSPSGSPTWATTGCSARTAWPGGSTASWPP